MSADEIDVTGDAAPAGEPAEITAEVAAGDVIVRPADDGFEASAGLEDGTRLSLRVEPGSWTAGRSEAESVAADALSRASGAFAAERARKPLDLDAVGEEAGIVGQSAPMCDLFRMLDRIRASHATVLVTGENGTGKELVAKAIHKMSRRAKADFVATNCSAFNDNLLESELFGHRRGAFTGAVSDKAGLFQIADDGTFFLDAVGDMSSALQVKLLRVLQEGTFTPVGGTEPKKVDVRIVAATNRDLNKMVADGTFRQDLYYRLHVVHLRVPPLRERKDDIPLLVDFFLRRLAQRERQDKTLSSAAYEMLMKHDWPGNVRELENEIERVWVLSGDDALIGSEHLSPSLGRRKIRAESSTVETASAGPAPIEIDGRTLPEAVESLERRMISEGLERTGGNKTKTAEALGISRRNLIRKVQAYGLDDAGRGSR